MRTLTNRDKSDHGFTLIEMSVVIIIVGLLVAGGASAYSKFVKEVRLEMTNNRTDIVNQAIGSFRTSFGRYPCPASLTDTNTDVTYGRESNCEDFSLTPGNCLDGICTEMSDRSITYLSGGSTVTGNPWVRVGYVPFRALNIPEQFSYDGYGKKIKYAVTQHLTLDENFEANTGAIEILNDQNVSILDPAASAHFLIISHGENGTGGYTREGGRVPCTAGLMETDNCQENRANARYRLSQHTTAANANQFDDKLLYFTMEDVPLWQLSELDNIDIHQKTPGNIAVSVNAGYTISDTAEIAGAVRARQDVQTNNLCAFDEVSDCFPSSLIAGPLNADPTDFTDDLKCPPGEFMVGIQNGAADCEPEVFVKCPGAQALTGIDGDGNPICDSPPESCPMENVGICDTTRTLPQSDDGTTITVTAGDNGEKTYRCEGTDWRLIANNSSPSDCTCEPRNQTRNNDCDPGFTGSIPQERDYICPDATWTDWRNLPGETFEDNCTCVEITEQRDGDCPDRWSGTVREARDHVCGDPPSWTDWREISNTCSCDERRDERNRSCPGGLDGQYQQERYFRCPQARWTRWREVRGSQAANCTCNPRTDERPRTCPTGYTGTYYEIRDLQCPSGNWTRWREDPSRSQATNCEREPVRTCNWSPSSSGNYNQTFALGAPVNSECECDRGTGSCHSRNGPNSYTNYSVCTCE